MCGYFSGLSSPSVTEMTTTFARSPTSNSAGQTRLPTFSTNSSDPAGGSSSCSARCTISASRWQPAPVLTCTARAPARRIRSASKDGLLVALDHADRTSSPQLGDRPLEQGGLAGAGGAHQVERGDVAGPRARPGRARRAGRSWPAAAPRRGRCRSRRPRRSRSAVSPQPQVRHTTPPGTSTTETSERSSPGTSSMTQPGALERGVGGGHVEAEGHGVGDHPGERRRPAR